MTEIYKETLKIETRPAAVDGRFSEMCAFVDTVQCCVSVSDPIGHSTLRSIFSKLAQYITSPLKKARLIHFQTTPALTLHLNVYPRRSLTH